ncbi:MAG: DUF4157 domain-containing protein [Bacteroidota bacterium]
MPPFSYKHPRKSPSTQEQGPFFKKEPTADAAFFDTNQSLQPKLTIGAPNDKYEQEADAVANQVVKQNQQPALQKMGAEEEEMAQGKLQRMEEEEEAQAKPELQKMEEEEMQAKPELQTMEEEEEAQAKPELQKMEEEEEAQAKPELQKMEEEEEVQAKPNGSQTASSQLTERVQRKAGQGQSLPATTNQQMSQAMGRDFSDVNIHTDAEAARMNQELGAQAFTHGKDVFFNQGKYQPETSSGKELLAHELTHVVQQTDKKK